LNIWRRSHALAPLPNICEEIAGFSDERADMNGRYNVFMVSAGVLALAATVVLSLPNDVAAQGRGLGMLARLTKGGWTIKFRDGSPDRRLCLRTGQELIQLRHSESGCNQFVIEDADAKVTVQYTCPSNGFGRTSVRRETGSLIQIESQGIAGGLPFQLTAEARHTGRC
jgi:hypothetical protein